MSPRAVAIKNALREYVKQSAASLSDTRREIREKLKEVYELPRMPSGMAACLLYLQLYVGEPILTAELEIVSGIPTYARRLRQLRVEQGYDIVSEPSQEGWTYTLRDATPNPHVAALWKKRNTIRRIKGSGEKRILEAFKAFLGEPLDIDDLAYVSQIKTARERVRDLRLQKGWRIFGHHTGRPDLGVTEYVLESLEQLPPHDRYISDAVYEQVLERDDYNCKKAGCGWSPSKRVQGSRRQFLEVHHRQLHSRRGSNDADNLVALCNMHHDEVHRLDIDGEEFDAWLKRR